MTLVSECQAVAAKISSNSMELTGIFPKLTTTERGQLERCIAEYIVDIVEAKRLEGLQTAWDLSNAACATAAGGEATVEDAVTAIEDLYGVYPEVWE